MFHSTKFSFCKFDPGFSFLFTSREAAWSCRTFASLLRFSMLLPLFLVIFNDFTKFHYFTLSSLNYETF